MRKKRILVSTEFSRLNTGYSQIAFNLLHEFHKTEKYELFEHARYYKETDPYQRQLASELPWTVIGNLPINEHEEQIYNSNPTAEFGSWKWEKVCLDVMPDIVITYDDFWMHNYIDESPFRRFYKTVFMPTLDANILHPEWIDLYQRTDYVLTYTDWSANVLREESGNTVNIRGTAGMAADINTYFPIQNKKQHKINMGVPQDSIIIGMVARNQRRKRYPEFAEAFVKFLHKFNLETTENTYLYWHTSHPDVGFNIPDYIKNNGLSHKIFLTYYCHNCHYFKASHYEDVRCVCPRCGQGSMILSNSQIGVDNKAMNAIYNLMDLYVQFSVCFAAGTQVKTLNGYKNIEDIKIGEEVLTDKNRYRKVINKFHNLSKDRVVKEISFWSLPEKITVTENHNFPCYTKKEITNNQSNETVKERIGTLFRTNKELPNPGKHPISELVTGDILLCPIEQTVIDVDQIDLEPYTKYGFGEDLVYTQYNSYDRFINIDHNFCKFLGLYAADGSVNSDSGIKITCGLDEEKNIELSEQILSRFSDTQRRYYKNRKALDVIMNCVIHKNYFKNNCFKRENKKLPDFVLYLPQDKQKQILIGYFMGDGHYLSNKNITISATISKNLYKQLLFLLRRLKIDFNVRLVIRKGNRKPQYRFEIFGNGKTGEFEQTRHSTRNFYYKNYHCIQIKNIIDSIYNNDVYNIEVAEDHTYTVSHYDISTYNCEGFGSPSIESAMAGCPQTGTYYTGTKEIIDKLEGHPLIVQVFTTEGETGRLFATPDVNELTSYISKFTQLPESIRSRMSFNTVQLARKHYSSWVPIAQKWMDIFDEIQLPESNQWTAPIDIVNINGIRIPENINDEQFVNFLFNDVLHRPDWSNTYRSLKCLRDLTWGRCVENSLGTLVNELGAFGIKPKYGNYNREIAFNQIAGLRNRYNQCEMMRNQSLIEGRIK